MGITSKELEFYQTNGYFLKKGLVSSEDIARIHEEVEDIHNRMSEQPTEGIGISWEVYDSEDHPPRIKQLMHSELVSPTFNRLLRSDGGAGYIRSVYGRKHFTVSQQIASKNRRRWDSYPVASGLRVLEK